jgi:hypothetical protein
LTSTTIVVAPEMRALQHVEPTPPQPITVPVARLHAR